MRNSHLYSAAAVAGSITGSLVLGAISPTFKYPASKIRRLVNLDDCRARISAGRVNIRARSCLYYLNSLVCWSIQMLGLCPVPLRRPGRHEMYAGNCMKNSLSFPIFPACFLRFAGVKRVEILKNFSIGPRVSKATKNEELLLLFGLFNGMLYCTLLLGSPEVYPPDPRRIYKLPYFSVRAKASTEDSSGLRGLIAYR